MKSGKIRHRVSIMNPVEAQSDTGEVVVASWSTLASVWVSIEPLAGGELTQADQMQAEATIRIRLRYLSGLTTQSRIHWNDRIYEIVAAQNIEERNIEYELLCHEAV